MEPSLRRPLLLAALGAVALLVAAPAHGIPAFARKYRTSCQTCHATFPKLTPFGEAFRLSGYQYPDKDIQMQKGRPLDLGSEKYKDVFPDAVWPGRIVESVPLAIRVTGAFKASLGEDEEVVDDFQFPAVVSLNFAGTLSEDMALWTGVHLAASGDLAFDKVLFVFANMFEGLGAPRHLLNLRVGQFEPEAQPFSAHRMTTISLPAFSHFNLTNWVAGGSASSTAAVHAHLRAALKADESHDAQAATTATPTAALGAVTGGTPMFALDRGAEIYGVIASRLLYSVGVFSGNGTGAPVGQAFDIDSQKDVTGRLAYKLGGMGFDGAGDVDAKPWRELSCTLGGFVRWGKGTHSTTLADGTSSSYGSTLLRAGGDLDLRLSDFQLLTAVAYQRESNPVGLDKSVTALAWFAEASMVWLPWLSTAVRTEGAIAGKDKDLAFQDAIASVAFLLRPNVKALLEASVDLNDVDNFSYGAHTLYVGLDAAF